MCGGTDLLFGTTTDYFHLIECAECRLLRLHPQPEPCNLHRYYPAAYYYQPGADTADRLAEAWRRFVLRDHINFVRRALDSAPSSGAVLDVGCGGGLFLRELALPPGRAVGLDFSLSAASVAWNSNGVPTVCGSLSRTPFADRSCAAITMFHVLEHLYDPVSYIENARRLLRPDGRLVIQVPNAACWQFLIFGERWNGLDIPRHLIDFRAEDLISLLEYCGFEVLRKKYFSLRDNPAGFASSLAPGLDPMGRRVRHPDELPRPKLLRDLLYFALTLAAIPFTMLEAACRSGSTIMIEARPKP
jgi:SAM-dependent methyltransferase